MSRTEETGSAAKEATEAVTSAAEEAPSQTEEAGEAAKEAIEAPTNAAEETADEGTQQTTVAETKGPSTETEETLAKVKEALRKAEPPMKMIPDWGWIVIISALIVAAVMISVGILSIR